MVDYTETVEFSVVRAVATAGGAPISSTYSAWAQYATVTITNPPAVSDYQVQVPVAFVSGMNADFSDLRFTDTADAALPYWIEWSAASTSAVVWVKVASGTTSILLFFENAAATSESNGSNVFDFFDDFSGASVDTAKWNVLAGAAVSGGQLVLSGTGGAFSGIASKTSFSAPYRAISRVRCSSRATQYVEFGFGVHQAAYTGYVGTVNGYRVNESDTSTHGANIQKFSGSWTNLNSNLFDLLQNTYFRSVLSCLASGNTIKLEFQPDGGGTNIVSAVTTDTTYTSGYLSLINFGQTGTTTSTYDFIAVGKYAATSPTCSVGAATPNGEQPAPYVEASTAYHDLTEFSRVVTPSIGPAAFGCTIPFSVARSPTVAGGSAYSETVEFAVLRAPDPPRAIQLIEFTGVLAGISTVKGSTTDSFWTLNQEIDEAHPLSFEARLGTKIIRQDKAGIEHCVFYGFLPEKSTQLAYCANGTNVVGYDYGEYLSEQNVPAELLVLSATQEPSTWIYDLLGGASWESTTGVMPYRIHVFTTWGTTIPAKEFPFKRDTPIIKAIKDVCDYYGYIFTTKWINLGPVLSVDNPDPSRRLIVIGAADYDPISGTGYSDHEPANLGGAYRPNEGVDVELFPTEKGASVGWIRDGEWLKFTRTFPWTGQYALSFRVACMGEACYFDVSIDGVHLSRINTGADYLTEDYSVFVNTDPTSDGTIASVTAGEHVIRIDFGGNIGEAPNDQHQNLASITCSPIPTGDALGVDHFIPAAYLLGENELDSITNGLDLPTPRTFTNPSDAILNNVKISQKATNTCNRVVVGGHDAQGVWWWVTRETSAVTHDGELAREKTESPDSCTTVALTETYADNLLAYYQLDQQSYDLSVDQGMDLQPYQLVQFVGYDEIPAGWCRIVSVSYHCEYLNDYVDISVVPVATFTAQRRLTRSLMATNTNIIESIVDSKVSDIPGILVGTVTEVGTGSATVNVETGGTLTTRCT